jgi:hAT family C-terminal dimerisation region
MTTFGSNFLTHKNDIPFTSDGAEVAQKWVDAVFSQGRQLAGAGPPRSHLAVQLEGRAGHFGEFWLLVRDRYPDLFKICTTIACVMPTTAAVESNFSRLRCAKTDYRGNLSCLVLEGAMQASDLLMIADKVSVPFSFPRV